MKHQKLNDFSKDNLIEIFLNAERKDGRLSLLEWDSLNIRTEVIFQFDKILDKYYYSIQLDELDKFTDKEIIDFALQGWILNSDSTNIIKIC